MSCGRPHETPCVQVLALVHTYLDDEVTEVERVDIHQHLGECPPCDEQFQVVRTVKLVIQRSCTTSVAPDHLRSTIVTRIRQVSMTVRTVESDE